MCLAVPAEVVEIDAQGMAKCSFGQGETAVKASTMLVDKELSIGDYVLIHAGFILRKLDPEEALETLNLIKEMALTEQEFTKW